MFNSSGGVWQKALATMPVPLDDAGFDYHPQGWGLVIAGGLDDRTFRTSVSAFHTVDDGASFASLAPMPEPGRRYNCLVVVDDNTLFVAGGFPTYSSALVYYKSIDSWFEQAEMPTPRMRHGCGLVGGQDVVVAGGAFDRVHDTADIFNMETRKWRRAGETDVLFSNRRKTFLS